jgi:hypothetical protein
MRREKPIPGGGREKEREGEREGGRNFQIQEVHCDNWHMRNLSVYSVWQTSVHFS